MTVNKQLLWLAERFAIDASRHASEASLAGAIYMASKNDDKEFDVPDDEDREGVPPNPDGSVTVGQLDLFCAITAHLAKRHPGLMCQSRQMNAVKDAADLIVAEWAKPIVGASHGMGLSKWLKSDDTGLSSREMARTLAPLAGVRTPVPDEDHVWHGEFRAPSDTSDFGRCLRLLEAVPELTPHLPAMSARSPLWAAYVARWDELTALYREEFPTGSAPKLFGTMQQIQDDIRKQTNSEQPA